jgi:hypothetical protein
MAQQQQKMPKGGKNLPSAEERAENARKRPDKVKHAREVHESNAAHCCGKAFADRLHLYYLKVGTPGPKHGKKRAKRFD